MCILIFTRKLFGITFYIYDFMIFKKNNRAILDHFIQTVSYL